ncbi:ABC transporter permease [Chloroflexia bacterium SDU3-3]|nr:ABC transporter permease [Chloroflexia bacterium SDU3-3]
MIPPTLLKTSYRTMLRQPWQILLAILGVALGVAVVVAIDLANDSARQAFALSTETLTGKATHQLLGGPRGVDEALYRRLRQELGLRDVAPLVDGYAADPDRAGLTLHILGIDPFAEAAFRPYLAPSGQGAAVGDATALLRTPGAALISAGTASAYGIRPGDHIRLQLGQEAREALIIGLITPEDETSARALDGILVADIATAQEWLGKLGRLSQIDLILPEGDAGAAQAQAIQAMLPADTRLARPAARTEAIQQMTAAFELNLSALSMLALVVGMFLIYNTMTFSVVQRRGQIGTLRCIGVARGQIFALVLGEALLVGLVGSLLGLALGVALGRGLVGLVTQTINDLYFAVSVRSVAISALPLVKGFALGMLATLAAAAAPAFEATTTPPRMVLRRSSYEQRVRRAVPLVAGAGAALIALGCGLLAWPSQSIVLGFAALFAITIGAAAVTPLATLLLMDTIRPLAGRVGGLLGRMAARDVVAALSRTSVAIAALMIAIAVTIGVGLMVGSFRQTVVQWLGQTLQADIYISTPAQNGEPLAPELIASFGATPGVAGLRRYREASVDSAQGPTQIVAVDVVQGRDDRSFTLIEGQPDQAWPAFTRGAVVVSEPLSYRRGLHAGDVLQITTDRGPRALPIAGVFTDYASDQGRVFMSIETYQSLWDDPAISSLAVYAAPGQGVDALVERLRAEVGAGQVVQVRSNQALREQSLVVFDRTFAITRVLQLLAMIVAFIGILSALMALELERGRELGVLRANGLTPRQLWAMVLSQTGLMGLTAGLLAIPMGVALASVLVFVINKRSFGWSLLFSLDGGLFAQALLVAVVAALLAGVYPAWKMGRTSPALALREE